MAVKKKSLVRQIAEGEVKGAPRALLEELFEDYYHNRRKLYVMNLIRGVFFGFGTAIGGTILVALLLWLLSVFHYIPFLNGIVDATQHSLQQGRR